MRRLLTALAFVAIATNLTACSDIPEQRAHVEVRAAEVTTPTTVDRIAVRRWHSQILMDAVIKLNAVKTLNDASRANAVAVNNKVRAEQGALTRPPATAPPSSSIADIMACIRAHESGDYTIHNHGYSGSSGAYQVIRSTWLAWSAQAGYGGYDAAYLAPPSVQDAVVVYMLTHGGAHNWDPKYGDDPCTVGMP